MRHAEAGSRLTAAADARFALVVSRFNEPITDRLAAGARQALAEAGAPVEHVEQFAVPGAFELPQAARCAAQTRRFDAIVCLGCVIRGETPHFEYISAAVAHGLMHAAEDLEIPVAFGVLTTDTWQQAEVRAADGRGNKGYEAAAAALDMVALFRALRGSGSR